MRTLTLAVALAVAAPGPGATAQDFPSRPITFVIPLGAGGVLDVTARVIGPKLSERLGGRTVVIENRTGGGTVIGAQAVARAAPDGHTLLFAPSGTLTTNVTLYKSLPYDPVKDFVPIALYVKIPFVLVVHPSLPVQSVADLIKLAKSRTLSYASTGTGAVPHMAGELLKSMTGIEMTHVPYRGVTQTLTDVIAGHVDMTFASPESAMPAIKDGRVRALGVSSLTRVPVLPEVAPIADSGLPGFEAVSWHLVVAPAGTPAPVVSVLHRELKAITGAPEMQRMFADMGLIAVDTLPVDELRRVLADEIALWGKLVRQAGIAGSQ
ncbi:MAG TPA: tripartite tricarboxylate transporter substrate binding protein [Xanthobacteraceae bacterium]|nr:tripartite tricarboxylate transporter substrate binding protein [Xanthobacteraceae bacterium]